MKKIVLFSIVIVFSIWVFAQTPLTDLTTTTSVNDADWMLMTQAGNSRKISVLSLHQYLATLADPNFTGDVDMAGDLDVVGDLTFGNSVTGSTLYVEKAADTAAIKITDYTLVLADAFRMVTVTRGAEEPVEVTIPPNVDVAFPIGTTITFLQGGVGAIKFLEGAAVNMYAALDSIHSNSIWNVTQLYKRGTNNWILIGTKD